MVCGAANGSPCSSLVQHIMEMWNRDWNAQIVHIRNMKTQGKRLGKQDQEWYAKNRSLVDMKQHYTEKEKELLKKWGGA